MNSHSPILLDCTLRDGGYYNNWDFDQELVDAYLQAMSALSVDYVELGFRSFNCDGFKGAYAYTTDRFVQHLQVPSGLKLGVMVNASELIKHSGGVLNALALLFNPAKESPITLVRIACHIQEIDELLPGCAWLKEQGYTVGVNLMQIADRTREDILKVAKQASRWPLDVLYFADSMGSINPAQASDIIATLRSNWSGALGIHTHDNMGQALANSIRALTDGVTWLDGTVTGMGRGPGNVKTEYLVTELAELRGDSLNITPLLTTIGKYFRPLQARHNWGTNTYYYLAGKYGIHPTFIQEMLADPRFGGFDVLAVIDHLRGVGGKKYSLDALERGLHFFKDNPKGSWSPVASLAGREVLILGTGPSILRHQYAIEDYIRSAKPVVIALNAQKGLAEEFIDFRIASHPVRLLEDCQAHMALPQPLITPASMLPDTLRSALKGKELLDFGFLVQTDTFQFEKTHCVIPKCLTLAYALAIASSGQANRALLAGFDGYRSDDPRAVEMNHLLSVYQSTADAMPLLSITPSRYNVPVSSVYSMCDSGTH